MTICIPSMGDMVNGVDNYNRGAVLGETKSHQSVSVHCGQARRSECPHAASAPCADFKEHREGRRLPGGTQHGLIHEPSLS